MTLSGDVLLFSTSDWDCLFWTNKQHVACQLARRGFRVLYVESLGLRRPTLNRRDVSRVFHKLRNRRAVLRQVHPGIFVFTPMVLPLHSNRAIQRFNEKLLLSGLDSAMSTLQFREPLLWTYNPLIGGLAERLGASRLIYHCVDDLTAAPHLPAEAVREAERSIATRADAIFTTSRRLERRFKQTRPEATYYHPNVVDAEHFAAAQRSGPIPEDLTQIPRPRVGFIGAISGYKVDFQLVAEIARARRDLHWVMIGQIGEGEPGTNARILRCEPNVHLLGPKPYSRLPDYLRGLDVATIPAPHNAYTAAMFPMKFFEYLAAARPVVATRLPALEEFEATCVLADTPDAFLRGLERAVLSEGPDTSLGIEVAHRHTWAWRMNEMLDALTSGAPQAIPRAA